MKFLNLFFILILITNCSLNKVVKHHGVHNLKKKNEKLNILNTNRNDVIKKLGLPSTKSTFDTEVWIYMERKTSSSQIRNLGKQELLLNDVLILEFDTKGMLVKKEYLTKENMNNIKVSSNKTQIINKKDSFVDSFLTSLRQKINDPLGIKKAK